MVPVVFLHLSSFFFFLHWLLVSGPFSALLVLTGRLDGRNQALISIRKLYYSSLICRSQRGKRLNRDFQAVRQLLAQCSKTPLGSAAH